MKEKDKEKIVNLCRDLLDSFAIVKGYIQESNKNNVNYSLIILKEIINMEASVTKIYEIHELGKEE